MFNSDVKIKPVFFDNLDAVFDEKGSMFLSMRKTQWCKDDEEPDREKAKLELRKWRVTSEGERADKGIAFLTDEGPGELAKVLIHEGYGDTKELLLELKTREDFKESVEHLFDDQEESSDGEYFDMRTALLTEEPSEEFEDESE